MDHTDSQKRIHAVAEAIRQLQTTDELQLASGAIKDRWRMLQRQEVAKMELSGNMGAGDRVWFLARSGRKMLGTVKRFNTKTVSVDGDDGRRWKVPPRLLNPLPAVPALEAQAG